MSQSSPTLVTALNSHISYDKAAPVLRYLDGEAFDQGVWLEQMLGPCGS